MSLISLYTIVNGIQIFHILIYSIIIYTVNVRSCCNIFTLYCIVLQETFEALHHLSKLLDCQPSQFTVAGLKDKRAITSQQVTVKNITTEQ